MTSTTDKADFSLGGKVPMQIRFVGGPHHNKVMRVPELSHTVKVFPKVPIKVPVMISWWSTVTAKEPAYQVVYYQLQPMMCRGVGWWEYHYKCAGTFEKCGESGTTREPILGFEISSSLVAFNLYMLARKHRLAPKRFTSEGELRVLHSHQG